MKHPHKLPTADFMELANQVMEKCRKDYENDPLVEDGEHFSWSKVSKVGQFIDEPFEHSFAYYLLKNPKVFNYLKKFYQRRRSSTNGQPKKDMVHLLASTISSSYLNKKISRIKGEAQITMQSPYNVILPLYVDNWISYKVYYASTKSNRVKFFYLKLNLLKKQAVVSGLHDDKDISYAGPVTGTMNTLYLNLERKNSKAREQLNLFINRGEKDLEKLNDIPGCFLGVSSEEEDAIGGEFFLLREHLLITDNPISKETYELHIHRHLNLHRNSHKAYRGSIIDKERYDQKYNYTLDVLDKHAGTYMAAYMKDKQTLVIGRMEIKKDYSTTLKNLEIDDGAELNCPIRITRGEKQALLLEIYLTKPEEPCILALINLPFGRRKETLEGCYCNVIGTPSGGALLLKREIKIMPVIPMILNMKQPQSSQHKKLWEELKSRNPFI